MTKSELRKIYAEIRRSLPTEVHADLSRDIALRFFEHIDLSNIRTLHCFVSVKHAKEVESWLILQRIWSEFPDIRTFAPRVNETAGVIDPLPIGINTGLVENKWRVPEPAKGDPIDPEAIDLVIVPLLCYDARGYRVGYGKGFYDKFLAVCRADCLKIGLSFFPPVDRIDDIDGHDMPLDLFITPGRAYTRRR